MAKKGTEMVSWRKELADEAAVAAKAVESLQGGQFFSVKGGQLTYGGNVVPGNTAVALISAWVFEHALYEGDYDADNPQSPICFAFGEDEMTMAPHEKAVSKQATQCSKCEHNKFGSADKGKGKACKNVVRLCLLPAGSANNAGVVTPSLEAEAIMQATPGYLRVPVTSVRGFATYVTTLANGGLQEYGKVPVWAVVTAIKPVPDPKTQVKVTFTAVAVVDDDTVSSAKARHIELQESIGFPYQPIEKVEDKKPAAGKKRKF